MAGVWVKFVVDEWMAGVRNLHKLPAHVFDTKTRRRLGAGSGCMHISNFKDVLASIAAANQRVCTRRIEIVAMTL